MRKNPVPGALTPTLLRHPYDIVLCTTEKRFQKLLAELKIPRSDWPSWLGENARATTSELQHPSGKRCLIVSCPPQRKDETGAFVAALIVHEAVHVWQAIRDYIGEREPGAESEAYAVEAISQTLFNEFIRQTVRRR